MYVYWKGIPGLQESQATGTNPAISSWLMISFWLRTKITSQPNSQSIPGYETSEPLQGLFVEATVSFII